MPISAKPLQGRTLEYCKARLREEHQALLDLDCFKDQRKYLVIALDEFQTIAEEKKTFTQSHIFCKVIKFLQTDANNLSTWVIFASTNSRIDDFSASSYMRTLRIIILYGTGLIDMIDDSELITTDDELLFEPFHLLQLDVFVGDMDRLEVKHVGSYEDTISFGRPL
jgi:hypothetical protein